MHDCSTHGQIRAHESAVGHETGDGDQTEADDEERLDEERLGDERLDDKESHGHGEGSGHVAW